MSFRPFQQITKKQRAWLIVAASVIVVFITAYYLFVPVVARHVIEKKIAYVEKERNVTIDINKLKVNHITLFGQATLQLDGFTLKDNTAREPLMKFDRLQTRVQIWKGLHRTLVLRNMDIHNLRAHIVSRDGYCNYAFLKSESKTPQGKRDYRKLLNNLVEKANNYTPSQLSIDRMQVRTDIDSSCVRYTLADLQLRNGRGTGNATIQEEGATSTNWDLTFDMDKKKQQYAGSIELRGADTLVGAIPMLQSLKQLDVRFHKADGRFALLKSAKNRTNCTLSGSVHQLQCQHHYLAEVPVRIDSAGADLKLAIFQQSIEIDSTSAVKLNRAVLHPYLRFAHDKHKHIIFKINERNRDAEPLFSSLPDQLFQIIPNMKIEGKIGFNCLLDCDFGCLDSLKFDFNLINEKRSLHVTEGLGEVTRFNEQFEYTFYDHGEPVRNLWIGPYNPYFCPSYQIPELLKQSILASEDGAFFVHNGFCKSAMQQALIDDIKAGKMRRGGSTISMQLIKNLFLNRKKVLTRKFEEMLLVWMIEDQRMMSKERMFEIYVNIIEWAPGVIGIGEASEFYFHKRPNELTMPECLYLATLIRSPKHYASTLNDDGSVNDNKRSELEFVADRMVTRGFMTEAQRANFDSNVKTVIKR